MIITVVIPCFNEAHRLQNLLNLIENHGKSDWEWLFVNDGSQDDTKKKINGFQQQSRLCIRLLSWEENIGKGEAIKKGILQAKGKLVGFIDADLATTPLYFERFIDQSDICAGHSFLIGIRIKTQDGKVQRYFYRHLMGRIFQTYVSMLTGLTCYDTQCGFKLIATFRAQEIVSRMQCRGFAFDVEFILLALLSGMDIREEMVSWQEKGNSSIRLHHILRMLIEVYRMRMRLGRVSPSQKKT